MTEPISLDDARKERTSSVQGTVVCMACRHEWEGIAYDPEDVGCMLCPKCKLQRGVFRNNFMPCNTEFLVCECGCPAFSIMKGSFSCIACGTHNSFEGISDVE